MHARETLPTPHASMEDAPSAPLAYSPARSVRTIRPLAPLLPAALFLISACTDASGPLGGTDLFANLQCSIPVSDLFAGGPPPDGIPALLNPTFVQPEDPAASYLLAGDRIIGLEIGGQAWAIPHNIGWWHEIVNLDFPGGVNLAVTYCPLTGSSLVFDRGAAGGADFGVSGVLFQNNLVLFDRSDPASLWMQMMREARCGPADGTRLAMHAAIETTWAGWLGLHPDTRVVGSAIGMGRNYRQYPYGNYEQTSGLLFPQPGIDLRRFAKERTLGIPEDDGSGGLLFPFEALRDAADGSVAVASGMARGGEVVVFWDGNAEGAMAFRPELDGEPLEFRTQAGRILDLQTGTEWRLDGLAVDGVHAGRRLAPVPEAYVAFWFAWTAFHPEAALWQP
jgi:hypothetical protein